jgi:GTP-binding protein
LISSVTGQGVPELLGALSRLVTEARAAVPVRDGTIVIHRPLPGGIIVDKVEDGVFTVIGKGAERAVSLNDVTTDEAAAYIQDRLRRLGVDRLLARAGAKDGDLVHIGGLSFTWYRDQPEFTGDAQSRRKRRS